MAVRGFPDEWKAEHSIAPLEAEWRKLEQTGVCTPFQHFDWVRHLLTSPADSEGAVFVTGRRDGELCAVFPLNLVRGRLRWLGERWNNHNAPLLAADLVESMDTAAVDLMWTHVRTALGPVSASLFRRQPAKIGLVRNPFAFWEKVDEPTLSYARTLGSDWDSFYKNLHSTSTRKGLSRKHAKLKSEGHLQFVRIEDSDALHAHVLLMLEWKSAQVDALGRRNAFAQSESRQFFADYAAKHPEQVRVYAFHLDGRPIAITLLLEGRKELVLYQMAYEESPLARFSPGRLLMNDIMEAMIAEKFEVLDLSVGDDAYKSEICDRITEMTNSFAAHSAAGMAIAMKHRALTSLKGVIKANPPVHKAILQANRLLRSLSAG